MPHAFFHTTASFEGNMVKQKKLEPKFEEVSEPSQLSGLSGPCLKAKVHCVVTAVSRRARVIVSTARSLVGRCSCVSSVARRLLLSSLSTPE